MAGAGQAAGRAAAATLLLAALAACQGANDCASDGGRGCDDGRVPMAAQDAGLAAGTYSVTASNGDALVRVLNADGTFEERLNGEVTESGSWQVRGDNTCFASTEAGGETCYTIGPVAGDGTVTITAPDGTTTTMHKSG